MHSIAPLAHFDFVTHFGGAQRLTAMLVEELARVNEVQVLDAYGGCAHYLDTLRAAFVDPIVLVPSARSQTIGAIGRAGRLWRIGRAAPGLAQVIWRLHLTLGRLRPRVVWVNSEKALFCASRAVRDLPLLLYARGHVPAPAWYCRRDWRRLAGVCAISRATLDALPSECRSIRPRAIVRSAVRVEDLARSAITAGPLPRRGDDLVVVIAATLIPLKAQHVAIEGIARYRRRGGQVSLWLAGDTPTGDESGYAARLAKLCGEAGLGDTVQFLGWRDDVPAIMARADVVALTSESEGLPGALIEAMALARPVIATRVGGIPELVRDGWNGLLIEAGDADGFAVALQQMADGGVRDTMGQRGHAMIREQFDPAQHARDFASFAAEAVALWDETRGLAPRPAPMHKTGLERCGRHAAQGSR